MNMNFNAFYYVISLHLHVDTEMTLMNMNFNVFYYVISLHLYVDTERTLMEQATSANQCQEFRSSQMWDGFTSIDA